MKMAYRDLHVYAAEATSSKADDEALDIQFRLDKQIGDGRPRPDVWGLVPRLSEVDVKRDIVDTAMVLGWLI